MKPGMVTQIRINPSDCQAILDVLQACNINPYDGRSFAQCTSMALSALIGMARNAGALPEVDEFQYLNRMQHFLAGSNNKKRVKMAQTMLMDRIQGKQVHLEMPKDLEVSLPAECNEDRRAGVVTSSVAIEPMDEDMKKELVVEYISLNERLNEGEKLSQQEQARYDFLNKVLF